MRDRTRARNYSAIGDEFRRDHERRRAWGLQRRHAERLRHVRERQAGCWPDDLQIVAASVEAGRADPSPVTAALPSRGVRPPAPSRDPQTNRGTQAGAAEPVGSAELVKQAEPVGPAKQVEQAEPAEQARPVKQAEEVEQARPAELVEQAGPAVESLHGSDSLPSPEPCPPRSSHGCHPAPTPALPTSRYPATSSRRPRSGPQSPNQTTPPRRGQATTRPGPTRPAATRLHSKASPPNPTIRNTTRKSVPAKALNSRRHCQRIPP